MNKAIMMGRLTKDPEVKQVNDTTIGRFSLAVDRRYKKEGEATADFFDCTAFGKLAEFVGKYLHKGTKILLEGEVQNNNYTNREGQKVYGTRILAGSIEFAESKGQSVEQKPAEDTHDWQPVDAMDGLPFN